MNGTDSISYEKQFGIYPTAEFCPQYDPDGYSRIKAFAFAGVPLNGTDTKVFAFIGIPENCRFPAPAVILVHGGGCHPDCEWMNKWIDCGYIALAMDTTGYFPAKEHTAFSEGNRGEWARKIPQGIASEGFSVSPDNSGMNDINIPACDRWLYHAVSQVILAHNILLEDSRVDSDKIGISGISWGGVIVSAAIGIDRRFAFAVPVYGSAFLADGLSQIDKPFRLPENSDWLAEKNYDGLEMPVMWLCWNDDCCFSVNSNALSYAAVSESSPKSLLSMKHLMYHSHTNAYNCEEGYWFADRIINGKDVPAVSSVICNGELIIDISQPVSSIRLFYITGKMEYVKQIKYGIDNCFMKQEWQINNIKPSERKIKIPENAAEYYVEFTLDSGIVICSDYFQNK